MQGCKFCSHFYFYFILSLNIKAHTFTLNEYKIIIILEEAIKNVFCDLKKYLISSPWTISKIKNFTSFLKSREELQEKKRLKSDLIFIDDLSSYSLKYSVKRLY